MKILLKEKFETKREREKRGNEKFQNVPKAFSLFEILSRILKIYGSLRTFFTSLNFEFKKELIGFKLFGRKTNRSDCFK